MAELKNANRDRQFKKKPVVDVSTLVYGKIPPQSKELEEAVLGAIMLEKAAFDVVIEIIKPEFLITLLNLSECKNENKSKKNTTSK